MRHRLLLLALLAPGFLWAYLDHRVWPWDQAQYAEVTFKTLGAFHDGLGAGLKSMLFLLDFRAPGLTWLSLPYAALGGFLDRPELALLSATLTWQAGTVLACYWSAELISRSRLVAAAVAAFIAATPLFIGMNHQFFVEPLQTLAVALSFLLALRAREMSGEALLAALCGVTALGMGAKASFPLYAALPLAYAALVLASRRSISPMRAPAAIRAAMHFCAAGGLVLVALWYVTHLGTTFDNVRQSTVGSLALNYGSPGDFLTKLRYWISSVAVAMVIMSPFVLVAAAAGAAAGFAAERRREASLSATRANVGWIIAAAAVHLVAALATYSLQINDDTRFLEPLLPIVAILLAWLCSLRWPRFASSVLVGAALANYLVAYSYALGFSPAPRIRHPWLQAADRDPMRREQLREVVALTCDQGFNVVGVDYSWLSHFSANFYAAAAHGGRPECLYDSLGYAPSDLKRALKSLGGRNYYIGMRPDKMPQYEDRHLNLVSAAVFAEVAASDKWTELRRIDDTVVVFRRNVMREETGGWR